MHKDLVAFNAARRTKKIPNLHSGDIVKVYRKIVEGGKERIQAFQGMVIAIKGGQSSSPMITVQKISFGIGVELIFPLYSPNIEKIEVLKSTRSRRAKLYFVRDKASKVLSKKLKEVTIKTGKGKESAPAIMASETDEASVEIEDAKESVSEEAPKA